ncbi:hypothetical protein VCBJG01_0404 [Vibrio cholerae BJG-01]|nr:hypothetical protein VCBJG01_0404 [Vibrio cholerae BJG-01]EJH57157.1 hypothetical protein VCHC20A2_0457 [Vibrio cholerae HC-20A2]KKP09607.1 hypothetical protein VP96_02894 [Vibrio cholerae]CSA93831.1 Uncharacterised protein [Vibrio cholerae]CSC40275.1 Uncharacterised protein [Vibrio cholerae]
MLHFLHIFQLTYVTYGVHYTPIFSFDVVKVSKIQRIKKLAFIAK